MFLRSFDRFRAKLPMFSGKKIIILPIYVLFMVFAAFSIYQIFDRLPERLYSKGMNTILLALFPLFGILIVEYVGFLLVFQMWWWRDYLKKRYDPTSYKPIFLVGLGGIVWVLTVAFNQFTAFYKSSPSFWDVSDLRILATPLDTLLTLTAPVLFYIKIILGYVFLAFVLLIFGPALQVFGFDNLTVVYLYFPEESKIQENEIYSVIRHPAYTGALVVGFGGTIFTLTIFSFFFYICFLLGFYIHVHFVEEKKLIQRFRDSYLEYYKQVSAFFVRLKKIRILFRFLLKDS